MLRTRSPEGANKNNNPGTATSGGNAGATPKRNRKEDNEANVPPPVAPGATHSPVVDAAPSPDAPEPQHPPAQHLPTEREVTYVDDDDSDQQPAPPPPAAPIREPDELDGLDIDDTLKESLREMDPESRREIINDILRNQAPQRMAAAAGFDQQGPPGGIELVFQQGMNGGPPQLAFPPLFHDGPHHDDDDDEEEESLEDDDDDEEEDDEWESTDGSHDDEEEEHIEHVFLPPGHGRGRGRGRGRGAAAGGRGRGGRGGGGAAEMAQAGALLQMLQMVLGGRGGGQMPEGLMADPFLMQLNELAAQRALGIDGDVDDMDYEQLLALQERVGHVSKGINEAQIAAATEPVKLAPSGSSTAQVGDESGMSDKCMVCLMEYEEDEPDGLMIKKCKHKFHADCIKKWFADNKTCPICKVEVI